MRLAGDNTIVGTNWQIPVGLKKAVRLAAGALDVPDKEAAARILRLGLEALKTEEPAVRAVLNAAKLP